MIRSLMLVLLGMLFMAPSSASAHGPMGRPPVAPKFAVPSAPLHNRNAPQANQVDVRMMVVYATEAHSNVDTRLVSLTRYLSHMRFTGYELLDTKSTELGANGSDSFSIQGGRQMTVTLLSNDENRVRMRVQITAGRGGKLLDTTMSVNRNGTVIVAGPRYQDGILVLPLTVRY